MNRERIRPSDCSPEEIFRISQAESLSPGEARGFHLCSIPSAQACPFRPRKAGPSAFFPPAPYSAVFVLFFPRALRCPCHDIRNSISRRMYRFDLFRTAGLPVVFWMQNRTKPRRFVLFVLRVPCRDPSEGENRLPCPRPAGKFRVTSGRGRDTHPAPWDCSTIPCRRRTW